MPLPQCRDSNLPLEPTTLALVVATATPAGLVRGFAGFGAAMIYMPVASTVLAPKVAAPTFLVLDFVITLPLLANAIRQCDWRTVAPTAGAAIVAAPLGAAVLANADTTPCAG